MSAQILGTTAAEVAVIYTKASAVWIGVQKRGITTW
jgi:hypothetical protein